MKFLHFLYNFIGAAAGLALIPPYWLHQRRNKEDLERFRQRLGFYPPNIGHELKGRPRIWIHAVSVGEVGVAAVVARCLEEQCPGCRIFVSTTTKQGLLRAKSHFKDRAVCFYAPLDLVGASEKALKMVRPDVLALLETEIWPNLIVGARRIGARTAVLNGRISVRTISAYLKIRPLMRYILSHIDAFSMISSSDAMRIQSLGADAQRVEVHGNAKFDGPDPMRCGDEARNWAQKIYNIEPGTPVWVAGSTRDAEEPIVLEAFVKLLQEFPRTILILAPRHIHRTSQIEQWVKEKGLTCQRRTALAKKDSNRRSQVVLLDTIGELSDTYSVADLVFCGGSLVPKGGQNLLEPAVWAKPVMYGPSMEDFSDARQLIEKAGGGKTVYDAGQMADLAADWLHHPQKAREAGIVARKAIMSHRGAACRHAEVIVRLLNTPTSDTDLK